MKIEQGISFQALLRAYMQRMHVGTQRLGQIADIPKATIEGWLKGKIPRTWQGVCQVARALGVSEREINALLAAAGFPTLDLLKRQPLVEGDRMLLAYWVDGDGDSRIAHTDPILSEPNYLKNVRQRTRTYSHSIGVGMVVCVLLASILLVFAVDWLVRSREDVSKLQGGSQLVLNVTPSDGYIVSSQPSNRYASSGDSDAASGLLNPECPLFAVPFEGSSFEGFDFDGGRKPGHFVPKDLPTPAFEIGHTGQGVRFTGSTARLAYPTDQDINPVRGSIMFWVKPLWDGDDQGDYVFFEAGETWFNRFRIAKDAAGNFRFIVWSAMTEYGIAHSVAGKPGWQAGTWHHVQVTWGEQRIALYLDGKLEAQRPGVTLPASLGERMFVGSASPSTPDAMFAEAVIDDFSICDG